MRNLGEDRPIIIKPADKGSCVVIWDRENYLVEGYTQLSDDSTYMTSKGIIKNFCLTSLKKSQNC